MTKIIQIAPYIRLRETAKCLLDDDYLQKQREIALERHIEALERLNKKINDIRFSWRW